MAEGTRFKSRNMSASVEFMLFFFTLIRPSLGCEQITPLNSLRIRFIGEIRLGVSAIENELDTAMARDIIVSST